MRKKNLTKDCPSCEYCEVNDNSYFVCNWGKGKPKLIIKHKTKPMISCNLINKS